MKKYYNLYENITSFKNLLQASQKAKKGKRSIEYVCKYEFNLENELLELRNELLNKKYDPGKYKEFNIYEPKKRMISAAPYRDRVVHHSLCNIIEPIFERAFIFDSYANRKNKGTHKAINKFQDFQKKNKYVFKCDIKKYFPSIDHQILKDIIHKKVKCEDTNWLIDKIIDNSNIQEKLLNYFPGDDLFTPIERRKGLPIGNLTSQFFANIYLNEFDHFIKEKLKCKYYIRYVDDFAIFSNNIENLRLIQKNIILFLQKYRLSLNEKKSQIYKSNQGIKFLGFKIFKEFKLLNRDNIIRAKRRFKKYEEKLNNNEIQKEFVKSSINGWLGHIKHGNTKYLINKFSNNYTGAFSLLN